jgi:hypothetical protein
MCFTSLLRFNFSPKRAWAWSVAAAPSPHRRVRRTLSRARRLSRLACTSSFSMHGVAWLNKPRPAVPSHSRNPSISIQLLALKNSQGSCLVRKPKHVQLQSFDAVGQLGIAVWSVFPPSAACVASTVGLLPARPSPLHKPL